VNEVSCRTCVPAIVALRARGVPLEPLVEGLPLGIDEIVRPSNRISWDDYIRFLENVLRVLGGPDEVERLGSEYSSQTGILGVVASTVVSVRPIYHLGARWYGPSLFSSTRATCEDLPDGRIRQTIEILPGYRDSELFFRLMRAALGSVPRLLAQGRAEVEMELHPKRAVYTITLPPPLTLWNRVRRWRSRRLMLTAAIEELGIQQDEFQRGYELARQASDRLAAQTRRLETLHRLARALARHTDVSELADSIMKLLEGHFHFAGIALWLVPGDGAEDLLLRREGWTSDEPGARHLLRTANRTVGRIELWYVDGAGESEHLDEILPWIALALDNARTFEALSRQTRRLEEEKSERERAEQLLEQSQKLEAMGRLAGGIAHDFNNVLTAITGYAELALDQLGPEHPVRPDLEGIRAVSDRGAGLTKRILAFSRRQMLAPRRVDLNAVLRGMKTMLERLIPESIELRLLLSPEPLPVIADAARIEQALINVVLNSRDAMPGGGRIEIGTRAVEATEVEPDPGQPQPRVRYARLDVRDAGHGMSPATVARVFDPFFTTKSAGEGTGLGLSSAYGIVNQSGGNIRVESELERGTTVTIHLPLTEGTVAPDPIARASDAAPGGDETLLLVEDEDGVRGVIRRSLETRGYRVLEARHANEALETARAHPGAIDLLVTDLVLPGLDGRNLARRIDTLRSELRGVVYISGYTGEAGDEGDAPDVAHALLRKPFPPRALLLVVRQLLDS